MECNFDKQFLSDSYLLIFSQGCIFFFTPPPPWGGGKESKGLRAREENQRRVEKMERQREKKRKVWI
jgi:hypothetical protein